MRQTETPAKTYYRLRKLIYRVMETNPSGRVVLLQRGDGQYAVLPADSPNVETARAGGADVLEEFDAATEHEILSSKLAEAMK